MTEQSAGSSLFRCSEEVLSFPAPRCSAASRPGHRVRKSSLAVRRFFSAYRPVDSRASP
jgi:hypothetical protein